MNVFEFKWTFNGWNCYQNEKGMSSMGLLLLSAFIDETIEAQKLNNLPNVPN